MIKQTNSRFFRILKKASSCFSCLFSSRFTSCRAIAFTGGNPVLSVGGLSVSNRIRVVSCSSRVFNKRSACSSMARRAKLSTCARTSLFITLSVSVRLNCFCDEQLTRNRTLVSHRARGNFFHRFTEFIDISTQ